MRKWALLVCAGAIGVALFKVLTHFEFEEDWGDCDLDIDWWG